MGRYKITFGIDTETNEEIIEARNLDEAINEAYQAAWDVYGCWEGCDEYHPSEGHLINELLIEQYDLDDDPEDVFTDEDWEGIHETYIDIVENLLHYSAVEVEGDDEE